MSKQAKNDLSDQEQKAAQMQAQLASMFYDFTPEERNQVANYLNAYNLAAWIYNDMLKDKQRDYIELSFQMVLDSKKLDEANDVPIDQLDRSLEKLNDSSISWNAK